ncbi:MAG: methyltransferase domain-containing protein [Deltaproteobacteria bacterium]
MSVLDRLIEASEEQDQGVFSIRRRTCVLNKMPVAVSLKTFQKDAEKSMGSLSVIDGCPLNCDCELEPMDIHLPEGFLLRCIKCGQWVTSSDVETYHKRFRPFDESNPIDPNPGVHLKRLRRMKRHMSLFPGETRLLDVGCNIGTFLNQASLQGYRVTGVEPDEKAVQTAIESGLNVKCGYLHEVHFAARHFDIITLFEVIEHLKDPIGLLKECNRILKFSGVLFITTGNAESWTVRILKGDWDYFDLRLGHISFFCPSSIGEKAR